MLSSAEIIGAYKEVRWDNFWKVNIHKLILTYEKILNNF